MDIGWGSLNLFDKAVFITIKMDFKAVGGFYFACAVFFTDVGSFVILGIVGMFAFFSSFVSAETVGSPLWGFLTASSSSRTRRRNASFSRLVDSSSARL